VRTMSSSSNLRGNPAEAASLCLRCAAIPAHFSGNDRAWPAEYRFLGGVLCGQPQGSPTRYPFDKLLGEQPLSRGGTLWCLHLQESRYPQMCPLFFTRSGESFVIE
jgi:hypothetical protein